MPSNFKNGLLNYGGPVGAQTLFTQGNSYYVDPTNGSDSYDGKTVDRAKATLPAGYALLAANQNDVLYYMAGSSSISLSATLTWAKSYTHMVGVCAPVNMNQRARIFQTSDATALDPLINITGSGCSFRNFYINQGVADATSKVCVQVTGDRNYFENIHFNGIGNDTMDVDEAACVKLDGAHFARFVNCVFGSQSTSAGSAATNSELWLDGESSQCTFEDCIFTRRIEHETNHVLVQVEDALGFGAFMLFKNCLFMYTSVNQAYTGGSVFEIPAISSKTRVIILQDCMAVAGDTSATDWDSNDRGVIFNNAVAPAASAAGGLATIQ